MNQNTNYAYQGIVLIIVAVLAAACAKPSPTVFDTPEAAVQTLAELIGGERDDKRVEEVFGPGSIEVLLSGDDTTDRADYDRVKAMIAAAVEFEDFDENTKVALLGADAWPFPIPLTREGDGWRYDMAAGREELLNRRIGRNELWTLTALHELVDAQREYSAVSRDGKPPAFAQRFRSSEGKRDGLYWHADDETDQSPLGDLLADSEASAGEPEPFHGYYYRLLSSQGASAPGGEKSYLDEQGNMSGGFGAVAWPATYGNSGVMTFITNQHGIVFQKDLGAETEQAVAAVQSYDPEASWEPTADTILDAAAE